MNSASCSTCPGGPTDELANLCAFICVCNKSPDISQRMVKGKPIKVSLKQSCVNKGLDWLRESGQGQTIHSEVGYYMKGNPPVPLMKKDKEGEGTTTAISNFWHKYHRVVKMLDQNGIEKYTKGDLRIPDVVITNAANQVPSQNNIKQVVEIKFPGDKWGEGQKDAYKKIAGKDSITDRAKLTELTPSQCGCGDKKKSVKVPIASPNPELEQAWQQHQDSQDSNLLLDTGIVIAGVLVIAALVVDDILPTGITQADDALIPVVSGAMARSGAMLVRALSGASVAVPVLSPGL